MSESETPNETKKYRAKQDSDGYRWLHRGNALVNRYATDVEVEMTKEIKSLETALTATRELERLREYVHQMKSMTELGIKVFNQSKP